MHRPALLRRRELTVPTLWGWGLLLAIGVAAILMIGRNVHSFLARVEPVGAKVLVIEGWMGPEELDQGKQLFQQGGYRHIITTGGALPATLYFKGPVTYATVGRDYLVRQGIPADVVTALPTPHATRERTYLSAVTVREHLTRSGQIADAIDVFSSGTHARRTQLLYRIAFGSEVRIGILAAEPTEYDPATWWQSSLGAKTVIMEAISWIWTVLFFSPPSQAYHEQKQHAPGVTAPAG